MDSAPGLHRTLGYFLPLSLGFLKGKRRELSYLMSILVFSDIKDVSKVLVRNPRPFWNPMAGRGQCH